MSIASASPADAAPPGAAPARVLVWDAPTRVFHWLLVLCFAGAWLTGDSERWRLLHVSLGYTMAGLVAFRVAWGLVGTRHARFASFVRGPGAVLRYFGALRAGRPEHHVGHNPAGGLAIVALLALAAGTAATGWAVDQGWEVLEDLHEGLANTLLALVLVHVAAVVLSSLLHRENLVRAMFTGRKRGAADDGIRRPWRGLAAVLGFWAWQWADAPLPPQDGAERAEGRQAGRDAAGAPGRPDAAGERRHGRRHGGRHRDGD